ncbi:MAG TPA: multidrug effflux MFS transporter [Asticcacaulis sp.]|nr:multidrug effflux MFS transporter [Asticcacaulis sp.]
MSETIARKPHFVEFVALIASLMALGALGIDSMLPALPIIGADLNVPVENHLQWIVSIYFLGMGIGQLLFGILSDWLGRKRVLIAGVMVYVIFGLIAACSQNFTFLLTLRLFQGMAVATTGVVTRSIIRDLYSGPQMAKVMSISFVVFLLVPILAPSLGQLVLLVWPWRAIFLIMSILGAMTAIWAWIRLPETLNPVDRRRPDLAHLKRVAYFIITEPGSIFYSLAIMSLIGSLLAYVALMPQIFEDVFHKPHLMAGIFAACAGAMGAGSALNASLVERLGIKRISHTALTGYIVVTAIHLIWAWGGHETVISFVILQALTMGLMSLSTSNFSAVAMEKVGHVAGTAASLQGVITTVGGALVSGLIGAGWAGHIAWLPGAALGCGVFALMLIAVAEKGRLYRNS